MNSRIDARKHQEQHEVLVGRLEALIGTVVFSSEINLRLERITRLLDVLGNPQRMYPTVHVGGTSGKGSTCTYISNILQSDGYKVGLFMSPYLQLVNEMFVVNGMCVRTSELLEVLDEVEKAFPATELVGFGKPSYFETKFAMAALLFARHGVDVAVIEVGLGGRLDATNVVESNVSVLVSVGLDHTDILGDTIEKIAADKVEIIKGGSSVVCGFSQPSTQLIAQHKAAEVGAKLFQIHNDFGHAGSDGAVELNIPPIGRFQVPKRLHPSFDHNIACAAMAYTLISEFCGREPTVVAITAGIHRPFIPGRCEEVQRSPTVILDGAHNIDKLRSFFGTIRTRTVAPILVLATKMGREANVEVFEFIKQASVKQIITTTFRAKGIWKPMSALQLAALVSRQEDDPRVKSIDCADEALDFALKSAAPDDVICVTGSFFLVGDLRERWHSSGRLLLAIEENWA